MATLVICSKKECIHALARSDGFYSCKCSAIGINDKQECDSYLTIDFDRLFTNLKKCAELDTTTNKKEA